MAKVTGDAFEGRQIPKKLEQFADDTETQVVHIRLHKERMAALKMLFHAKGQDMTTGIRTVLYEWLGANLR